MTTSDTVTDASSPTRRRAYLLWAIAALAYAVDLGSKLAVVARLEGRTTVSVLGDWLVLRVQRNPGAAFGMGEATTIVFTLIATAVAVVVVRYSRRLASTPWAIALGLLLGGALGNLTDRLFRTPGGLQGAVVDFISVRGFSVMNLADWAITCGCALALLLSFRGSPTTGPVARSDEAEGAEGEAAA
ncbi:signal peptidase II [Streptomyces castrisilvae]|uniref:Lipoprotein signal peptidase n=1 Tax=Streptomyces castrisilvae TaxID=3033811 RepID=A0ABY9HLP6_9ACTN|nr:signal peptidase II [Streptomyces sp. Mut1]WLQ35466.1 signal peptidase II [Streptomyces sp. Mut1]